MNQCDATCKAFELAPRCYQSVAEMLANEQLDGLIIASPNHCHLENLREFQDSRLPRPTGRWHDSRLLASFSSPFFCYNALVRAFYSYAISSARTISF